jgi:polysaccharide export outer membrane protein
MAGGQSVAIMRDIQTLFDTGTASGLSDRQLLERFATRRDASAEAAFEALVLRHGPMVLRVCRNALGDATDAQDAFQATFLILVRRCSSIRRLESVGSWLYGVACRVAARARVEAARRRAAERSGALRVVTAVEPSDGGPSDSDEYGPLVQEEVRRLPEKYRAVVTLCYWQGLTQEQAAEQLGCPLGTVRSRLARARDLLRRRLTRRGLATLAGVVAAALDGESATASIAAVAWRLAPIPTQLIQSTIRAAAQVAAGQATAQVASGLTASLVQRVLWSMTMIKICKMSAVFSVVSLAVVGVSLWAQQPYEGPYQPPTRLRPGSRSEKVVQEKAKAPEQRKSGPAHVLEPPDLVMVEVLEALPGRPISGERLVRPDGTISLGFYGDIHVAGLTIPEAKEKIIHRLQKYLTDTTLGLVDIDEETLEPRLDPNTKKPVMIDPKESSTVFVDVTAYNSGYYYVEGEAAYPGRLNYTGNETVLDVIHFTGGLLPSADRSKIRLIRSFPKGSAVQVLPIDYEEITMGTDSSTNYIMLPNDRLAIPRVQKSESSSPQIAPSHQPTVSPIPARTYFSRSASTEQAAKQLESLRSIEKHLSEVENKLDKIINAMESGEKKMALPQNLWVRIRRKRSAPARQEGSPSRLHHHLAPVG